MPNTSTIQHPGNRALRAGRTSISGHAYLVTTVTHNRKPLFADFDVACAAAKTLTASELWPDAKLLAWVLMPDHLHLLVELGQRESLSLTIQRVKSVIAATVRQVSGLPPPIWQRGYQDHAMRETEDVKTAARYLVANPLRAGLAKDVGAYPFWDAVWLSPTS